MFKLICVKRPLKSKASVPDAPANPLVGASPNDAQVPLLGHVMVAGEPTITCVFAVIVPTTGFVVYPGEADDPVALPKTVFAAALVSEKLRAGVLVEVATDDVNSGDRLPALKLVTAEVRNDEIAVPLSCTWPLVPVSITTCPATVPLVGPVTIPAPDPAKGSDDAIVVPVAATGI